MTNVSANGINAYARVSNNVENTKNYDLKESFKSALQNANEAFSTGSINTPMHEPEKGLATRTISSAINSLKGIMQHSQNMSVKAVNGTANEVDVVTAITNAEIALNNFTAIRDKAVAAYNEIIKMPI